jgi:hypothetical protein
VIRTKETVLGFHYLAFSQVVLCHDFVMRDKPQEDMNSRRKKRYELSEES